MTEQISNQPEMLSGARSASIGGNAQYSPILTGDRNNYFGKVDNLQVNFFVMDQSSISNEDVGNILSMYFNKLTALTSMIDIAQFTHEIHGRHALVDVELAELYQPRDVQLSTPYTIQSLVRFLNDTQYALLIGEIGSGKTTCIANLILCLSGGWLNRIHANVKNLGSEWNVGALFPAYIELRRFVDFLSTLNDTDPIEGFWAYLTFRFGADLKKIEILLKKHLSQNGGIFIFDGLDEIAVNQSAMYHSVINSLDALRIEYPLVRIVITTRYGCEPFELHNELSRFDSATLVPFSPNQVGVFINIWCNHIQKLKKDTIDANQIIQFVDEHRYAFQSSASSPLLLTHLLAQITVKHFQLPLDRAFIYEKAVELLTETWEQYKIVGRKPEAMLQPICTKVWFGQPSHERQTFLAAIAFKMKCDQQTSPEATEHTINRADLLQLIHSSFSNPDLAQKRIVEYLELRAGIITQTADADVFYFANNPLVDYLASNHLRKEQFPKLFSDLVRAQYSLWQETAYLAAKQIIITNPLLLWDIVGWLCRIDLPEHDIENTGETDISGALMASIILIDVPRPDIEQLIPDDIRRLDRVKTWLEAIAASSSTHHKQFQNIAITLAPDITILSEYVKSEYEKRLKAAKKQSENSTISEQI
ncbi:MAG: hypothetical protein H6641_19355 [Caldilineaceae bacterium]|nr:hypothetical protein [Caldilineaceae bacterium]